MNQDVKNVADMSNIRQLLEDLEDVLEQDLRQILHGTTDRVSPKGMDAIGEIHELIKRAVRLGFGETTLISEMCRKYGIPNQ